MFHQLWKAFDIPFQHNAVPRSCRYGLQWQMGDREAVLAADGYSQIQWWILWILPNQKGVWQGCVLSPKLFNLYTEKIFNESDELPGCIVGGENFNNLRYADDIAMLADCGCGDAEQWREGIKYECEKDEDDGGMSQWNTRCENSGKWKSPRTHDNTMDMRLFKEIARTEYNETKRHWTCLSDLIK